MADKAVVIPSDEDDDDCIPVPAKIVKIPEILLDDENKAFTRTKTVKRYIYSSDSDDEEQEVVKIKKRKHSSSDSDFAPVDDDSDEDTDNGRKKAKKGVKSNAKEPSLSKPKRKVKADLQEISPKKKRKLEQGTTKKTNKTVTNKKQRVTKTKTNVKSEDLLSEVTVKEEVSQLNDIEEVSEVIEDVDEKTDVNSKTNKPSSKKALPKHADMYWRDAELLADLQEISPEIAENVINLFDTDNTIPFIARYRKELTGNMEAEKLRHVKESYDYIKSVRAKAITVMNSIAKVGKLTPDLERSIKCCRSLNEIEHFYAPYKTGGTGTLADRARKLGLEAPAMAILNGEGEIVCSNLVQPGVKGRSTIQEVITGCQHIIADAISKDEALIDFVRELKKTLYIQLECKQAQERKAATKTVKVGSKGSKPSLVKKEKEKKGKVKKEEDASKFENYYNFSANVKFIKPHQVLAIFRGENLKALSVKLNFPKFAFDRIFSFCHRRWLSKGKFYEFRSTLFQQSCQDAYSRLIEPLIARQVRSELLQIAVCAAIEVFASNLKALLLAPPLRGKSILGIDPGFRNGCKLAVISATGEVLRTDVIYPHTSKYQVPDDDPDALKLKDIITGSQCEVIALGNGTACRETEEYLSRLISCGWFKPFNVSFVIVSEQGASIYSCSPQAKKEFPTMDPNLISAVSVARRLQDPMAELVKIEPKHLGVGMYQHDVPEKKLVATLDEIVSECVSFVGVDINTASDCILRHIAGLSATKVQNLIEWRSTRGPFINRNQLKLVKGIGSKTFEQCAGFIRIMPQTLEMRETKNLASAGEKPNVLDQTWIHPESYGIVNRFLTICCLRLEDFGKPDFVERVHNVVEQRGLTQLSNTLECSDSQLQLIADALQKPPGHDLRCTSDAPLFRKDIRSMESLQAGQIATGCVRNVTQFGAFVDIGVGSNGLVHISKMKGAILRVGQKVEVKVLSVDLRRKRISLALEKAF
ncbi:S1 RNA-binding domain-containing protein 1 [Schistocerca serialis cubense]|uniref:S1 RNA-binding domain-containing protein 1 n=1 Tax=Schistocerca serialis cubense TaxID=2023355 RepID=UPI00214F5443|nr:S1 RNA-binding domain-containing protein 1 [Schistocerca serialis cubense]XP_049963185.1 S1 RNA-binding domain-containing protein 1 [Schistocerca serialis cubense]XP_049963186.1 S1 RNA-binding domain-containing protein 1 [Schistocerca serialis cubense]